MIHLIYTFNGKKIVKKNIILFLKYTYGFTRIHENTHNFHKYVFEKIAFRWKKARSSIRILKELRS